MSVSLDGIQNAVRAAAQYCANAACNAASWVGQEVCWLGRQIVALGPVLRNAGSAVASQMARLANATAAAAGRCFSNAASLSQQGYGVASTFVNALPRDVKVGAGSATVAIVTTLCLQKLYNAYAAPKKAPKA